MQKIHPRKKNLSASICASKKGLCGFMYITPYRCIRATGALSGAFVGAVAGAATSLMICGKHFAICKAIIAYTESSGPVSIGPICVFWESIGGAIAGAPIGAYIGAKLADRFVRKILSISSQNNAQMASLHLNQQ